MSAVRRRVLSASLLIGLFVLWEVICDGFHVSDLVLPTPSAIFTTLWQRAPAIWPHAVQTLYTTLLGFMLGVIAGLLLGILLGVSRLDTTSPTHCWWALRRSQRWLSCRSWYCGSARVLCRRC